MNKLKKILCFIYNRNSNSFLLLKHPKKWAKDSGLWFTVSGGVEGKETSEDAVKREVLEETSLVIKELFYLNWASVYDCEYFKDDGKTGKVKKHCYERMYLAFVDSYKVKLNEEHINYRWVTLSELVKKIYWLSDKEELKNVLMKGIVKKKYFLKAKVELYGGS